jgi:hypothetical protein
MGADGARSEFTQSLYAGVGKSRLPMNGAALSVWVHDR